MILSRELSSRKVLPMRRKETSCTQRGIGECGIGVVRDVARRCLQQIGPRRDLVMSLDRSEK